jgi:hypothetical protein
MGLLNQVAVIVIAAEANDKVIEAAATACGTARAPKAMTLPPPRVDASAMKSWIKFVAPLDHPEDVLAAKEKGPPAVSTDGVAAVAMGKLAWLFGTTILAYEPVDVGSPERMFA